MNYLRNKSFYLLDYLQNSKIRTSYNTIEKIDKLNSGNQEVKKHVSESLENLLVHATNDTPFYNKYNPKNGLKEFPIINKTMIKNDYSSFMSYQYKNKKTYEMSTSGSSGTPFTVIQNEEKKRKVNAEVIYYSNKVGYSVGSKLVFLRALTSKTNKSNFKQWLQNERLIDIGKVDKNTLNSALNTIKRISINEPLTILTYASTLDVLRSNNIVDSNEFENFDNIAGIISSSEMLFDETREFTEELFNCKVVSRYSNQENGILGQDETENNNFVINEANYFVEIMDLNEDKPLENGDVGRIVVTDLFNFSMPMIRYDTGDIGSIKVKKINNRYKKVISNFGGRIGDIITDSNGNYLSPYKIGNNMAKFSRIIQYQFIQKKIDHYKLKLTIKGNFDFRESLLNLLYEIVGENASITLELVQSIPKLPSGKYKFIVNDKKENKN